MKFPEYELRNINNHLKGAKGAERDTAEKGSFLSSLAVVLGTHTSYSNFVLSISYSYFDLLSGSVD